jgi:membrane protein required for beta-lactamase induction
LKAIAFDTAIAKLQFMQLIAVKAGLLVGVLSVGLGFLVVAFGHRYGAGWHSHVQRIMIGLSTASIAQFGAQGIWEMIARHTTPHSRDEYEHVMALQGKLLNTNSAIYVIVLIWWIVCLWIDEPGAGALESAGSKAPVREYLDANETREIPGS